MRARLANHVTGDQVAVQDVSRCGDETTAVTQTILRVCVNLQVPLTVCLSSKCWQANQTHKWTLSWRNINRHTHIITYKSGIKWHFTKTLLILKQACQFQEEKSNRLTTVCSHVDLQRAGTGTAFVALREGTQPLVRVGIFRLVLWRRGSSLLLLSACAVVHKMGLKIPLTSVPDPTVFARKNVFCTHKHTKYDN